MIQNRRNRVICGLCALLCISALMRLPSLASSEGDALDAVMEKTANYLVGAVPAPQIGSIGGEWAVLGLARCGREVEKAYFDAYYARVEREVNAKNGILHEQKYSEYARVILALTAIGKDPGNVAGYNLLSPLGDYEKTVRQGANGPVWALIALDSGGYDMPLNPQAATQATRQLYVDCILALQHSDGGFSHGAGGASDLDMTGMALQALAKYQGQEKVAQAVEAALAYLAEAQQPDGGFPSGGASNLESVVQVTVALCTLGISLEDIRFVKNGSTLWDVLQSFALEDGSFRHEQAGGSDLMATEQALYAMAAISRQRKGQNSLYSMGDAASYGATGQSAAAEQGTGLPGKHAHVQSQPVIHAQADFEDISGHLEEAAINAMASRGIINGKSEGIFAPDSAMTRGEYCAIVVRGLGLTPEAGAHFQDVSPDSWFSGYVGTANRYGIVNGVSETHFNPQGLITREEAAAMLQRAGALCGLETQMDPGALHAVLVLFDDYTNASPWAGEALAFCYGEGLYPDTEMELKPQTPIQRGEVAGAMHRLLKSANLL